MKGSWENNKKVYLSYLKQRICVGDGIGYVDKEVFVGGLALALLHVGRVLQQAEPVRSNAPAHPEWRGRGVVAASCGRQGGLGVGGAAAKVEGLVQERFHAEKIKELFFIFFFNF